MKNKANKLTLSLVAMAITLLHAQPDPGRGATIGVDSLRAPNGGPNPALSVDNNGNVGIGTSTPTNRLSISGGTIWTSSGWAGAMDLSISSAIAWQPNAAGYSFGIGSRKTSGGLFLFRSASVPGDTANPPLYDFVLDNNGNVGIGTTSPGIFKLRVAGATRLGATMTIGRSGSHYDEIGYNVGFTTVDDSYTYVLNNTAASIRLGYSVVGGAGQSGIQFRTAPSGNAGSAMALTTRMTLTEAGNLGIGIADPQARLDVDGQIRSTTLLLTSDRNAKAEFQPVDARAVLQKLARLQFSTWHYTNAPGVRHLGPMAQDFKAAFPDLGSDDKHIATIDADGVALASIQALYEMVREKDSEIVALKRQVSALKTELAEVEESVADRLAALEKAVSRNNLQQASLRTEPSR